MFESLADHIKHDEQFNTAERFLWWVVITVISLVAFGALYLAVQLLH